MSEPGEDRLFYASGDLPRVEAHFSGLAYAPHRHDTYTVAITLSGIQSFDYRGATRHSRLGQVVVLHPDEMHDGRAGDGRSFSYRAAYISPGDIQEVLGGTYLPFVAGGVSRDRRLRRAACDLLEDFDRPLTALAYRNALFNLAGALQAIAGMDTPIGVVNRTAVLRARDFIEARIGQGFSLDELERETGHGKWQLSRDFQEMFGTSPYRYMVLRRLDKSRKMMLDGHSAMDAAYACGFCDQSHFGRAFKRTFGLTPNVWLRTASSAHNRSIPVKVSPPL